MENKKRLIDAEDLLQTLAIQFDNLDPRWLRDRSIREGLKIAKKAIVDAPRVDAAQVRHAWWIIHKPFERRNFNECIECSECNTWFGRDCYAKTNYCPNCGAMMDLEG